MKMNQISTFKKNEKMFNFFANLVHYGILLLIIIKKSVFLINFKVTKKKQHNYIKTFELSKRSLDSGWIRIKSQYYQESY
jgi:nitrate reductase gamma subunit